MTVTDILTAISEALEKRRGKFAVIGAVARNAWAPPRATTDIDMAVASETEVVTAIQGALQSVGYRCVRRQSADPADPIADLLVFRSREPSLRQVDLIVAKTAFEEQVLRRAVPVDLCGLEIPVATPEDLVVYKLIANRSRDRDDILAVIRTQQRAGREMDWTYLERWAGYWSMSDRLEKLRRQVG